MIPGVLRTRVGYAGGTTPNPTYHQLGDHTECVALDFDPNLITFEQLLDYFWQAHNPFAPPYLRQYRSLILYHTHEQERIATVRQAAFAKEHGRVYTEIQPLTKFYLAEDYHQKFYLRRVNQIMMEIEQRYPTLEQLINSHEVARLNGYVGGYGTQVQLEKEIADFGLSPAAEHRLRQIVAGFGC